MSSEEQIEDLAILIVESLVKFGKKCPEEMCDVVENLLKKNQPELVVVGLSDTQIIMLTERLNKLQSDYGNFGVLDIRDWLKTQTFAQPQQLQPNWNDAPKDAAVSNPQFNFFDKNGVNVGFTSVDTYLRPNLPPASTVEVGQVWKYEGEEYEVFNIIQVMVDDEWKEGVQCKSIRKDRYGEHVYVGLPTPKFLTKFERVRRLVMTAKEIETYLKLLKSDNEDACKKAEFHTSQAKFHKEQSEYWQRQVESTSNLLLELEQMKRGKRMSDDRS